MQGDPSRKVRTLYNFHVMSKICIYSGILKVRFLNLHFPTLDNILFFIYLGELESKLQDTEIVLREVRIAWVSS